MRLPRSGSAVLALAWAVLVLTFWLGVFVPSMTPGLRRPMDVDLYGYFHPKMWWASTELAAGRLPLWNPYEFAGLPFLGMVQPAAAYPLRGMAFTLAPEAALHVYMVLHYFISGVFAFVTCRALGLRTTGAACATVAWVFSAVNLESHYHPNRLAPLTWVPLLFLGFARVLERPGPRSAALLALAAALALFAGYPEYLVVTGLCLLAFWPLAARAAGPAGMVPRVLWLAVAGVLGAALAGLQLGPMLDATLESVRAETRVGPGSEEFARLVATVPTLGGKVQVVATQFAQMAAMPAVVWTLAVAGAVAGRARFRPAMLAALGLAVVFATPLRFALGDLPILRLFRPNYVWMSLMSLPLAYLAGAGLEALVRPRAVEGAVAVRTLAAAAVLLPSARWLGWPAVPWLVAAIVLVSVARCRPGWRRPAVAGVTAIVVLALWSWLPPALAGSSLHRYTRGEAPFPPSPPAPSGFADAVVRHCGGAPQRVLAPWRTWDGTPILERVEMIQGYPEPLVPRRISRVLTAMGAPPDLSFGQDVARLLAERRWLDVLNVGCVVVPESVAVDAPALGLTPGGAEGGARFYRRETLPRAFVVHRAEAVRDADAAWAAVTRPGFEPRRTVVIEGGAAMEAPEGAATAEWTRLAPGRVRVRVASATPGLVVVSEAGFPGWRATVDGRAAPVYRADYIAMAVPVPAGTHEVLLAYRPLGARLGWLAQVLGLAALVVAAAWPERRPPG